MGRRRRTFTEERTDPISLSWVYILLALAEGPRHGYAVMQEVSDQTAGRVTLWPATLYGAVKRMLKAGLLEEVPVPAGEDGRRRYYGLTSLGRRVLGEETRRLAAIVELAEARDVLGSVEGGS